MVPSSYLQDGSDGRGEETGLMSSDSSTGPADEQRTEVCAGEPGCGVMSWGMGQWTTIRPERLQHGAKQGIWQAPGATFIMRKTKTK